MDIEEIQSNRAVDLLAENKRLKIALDAIWRESDETPEFTGDYKEGHLNSESLTNVSEMARNALDGKELNS